MNRVAPLLAGLVILCSACARAPQNHSAPVPRLVLLYATCTLNKDYLQPYNETRITPNLAAFARESAVFTNHQTESGLSGPAFASIFSGTQADRHGVFWHPRRLPGDLFLISEAFSAGGYESHYWSEHPMTIPKFNYSQGVKKRNISRKLIRARHPKFQSMLRKLRDNPEHRAFVLTSFSITHAPYVTGAVPDFLAEHPHLAGRMGPDEVRKYHKLLTANYHPFMARFDATADRLGLSPEEITKLVGAVDLVYQSRVKVLDKIFGEVLKEIDRYGLTEQSLIAFTADHGETLYDENRRYKWTHSPELVPEVINVPLMIRAAGVPRQRIDSPTRSIDVYPTIAGLAGVDVPKEAGLQGIDFSEALRGRAVFPEPAADSHGNVRLRNRSFSDRIEDIWASRKVGNTLYRWKLTAKSKWRFEVFDLAASTDLSENLFDPRNPHHKKVGDELWAYRMHLIQQYYAQNPAKVGARSGESDSLSDQDVKALKSLGYIQ